MMYDEEMYDEELEFADEILQNGLRDLILGDPDSLKTGWENLRVNTFEEAGVMTCDKGLVISLPNGTEYQLSIIRSR